MDLDPILSQSFSNIPADNSAMVLHPKYLSSYALIFFYSRTIAFPLRFNSGLDNGGSPRNQLLKSCRI